MTDDSKDGSIEAAHHLSLLRRFEPIVRFNGG